MFVIVLFVVLLTFGPRAAVPTAALIAVYIAYKEITARRKVSPPPTEADSLASTS
jgi:hypothetical protein